MTPKIYADYAISLNKYRWLLLVVIAVSVISIATLIFLKHAILGFALAGPLVLLPWAAFLLCYWFRPEVRRWAVILWCQAIMLDALFVVALSWPFMVIFG
jgi:hypothetical protein